MPRLNFSPQKHGFHFDNDFDNAIVTFPNGQQFPTGGRCGGMAYASLDYYFAGLPIPTHRMGDFPGGTRVPPDGTRLADYISARLFDSFATTSALKFILWAFIPEHDTWFRKGTTRRMREEEFPALRRQIDQGRPVVLGLLASTSLADIGNNHQVVAYGYEVDPLGDIRIF